MKGIAAEEAFGTVLLTAIRRFGYDTGSVCASMTGFRIMQELFSSELRLRWSLLPSAYYHRECPQSGIDEGTVLAVQ